MCILSETTSRFGRTVMLGLVVECTRYEIFEVDKTRLILGVMIR